MEIVQAVLIALQLLMAALFGILGVLFADPILAMLKVVLVDRSHGSAERERDGPTALDCQADTVGASAPEAPVPAPAAAAPASAAESRRPRGRSSAPAPQR